MEKWSGRSTDLFLRPWFPYCTFCSLPPRLRSLRVSSADLEGQMYLKPFSGNGIWNREAVWEESYVALLLLRLCSQSPALKAAFPVPKLLLGYSYGHLDM